MLLYVGTSFITGIPARNLTDAEAERFGRESLVASGLYEEVVPAEKPRKKKLKETVEQADYEPAEVKKLWE
jgi:hypothetical protein